MNFNLLSLATLIFTVSLIIFAPMAMLRHMKVSAFRLIFYAFPSLLFLHYMAWIIGPGVVFLFRAQFFEYISNGPISNPLLPILTFFSYHFEYVSCHGWIKYIILMLDSILFSILATIFLYKQKRRDELKMEALRKEFKAYAEKRKNKIN